MADKLNKIVYSTYPTCFMFHSVVNSVCQAVPGNSKTIWRKTTNQFHHGICYMILEYTIFSVEDGYGHSVRTVRWR